MYVSTYVCMHACIYVCITKNRRQGSCCTVGRRLDTQTVVSNRDGQLNMFNIFNEFPTWQPSLVARKLACHPNPPRVWAPLDKQKD